MNNNKSNNIFIYGEVNSKKEYLLKAFIEVYSTKKDTILVLIDPKKIEFEDFKNNCYYGYIIHEFEDLKTKFEKLKKIKSNIVIIFNEIVDFVYNENYYNDFIDIINYIKKSININFIISTQRNINGNDYFQKLDFILKDSNLVKFIF